MEWTTGTGLVARPAAAALASHAEASPHQVTRTLNAAHQVHWPNGNRSGEPQGLTRPIQLVGGLAVDDTGLGVGEQAARQLRLLGPVPAGGREVGGTVGDQDALDAELPRELPAGLQPARDAQLAQDQPGL